MWPELKEQLSATAGLEAKTIFGALQHKYRCLPPMAMRILKWKVKHLGATVGPAQKIYFAQDRRPGELCKSDFTYQTQLGIPIGRFDSARGCG